MAYQVTQINDLEQFGELNTTFLLMDSDGIMPDQRVDKTFKINVNLFKIIENDKKLTCLFYENQFLNNLEIKEEIQE
jgi:predicted P-loop ATPase